MMEFFKAIHLGIEAERTVNRECRAYSFSQTTESHRPTCAISAGWPDFE